MKTTPADFTVSKADRPALKKCVDRLMASEISVRLDIKRIDTDMDLSACHANGCPLDFEKLANAPEADFMHDVFGIRKHINRTTGELMDCFLPRCAKPETK